MFKTAVLCVLALATAPAPPALAGERAGTGEAVAMVKKAVAHLKLHGPDKAYADFNNRRGAFVDRDLYVSVYSLQGRCLAHGVNPHQIGRDLIDLTDIDGKYFIKERVALARSQPGGFWHEYMFTHPVSRKVEPKRMYCEKVDDTAVCSGTYS